MEYGTIDGKGPELGPRWSLKKPKKKKSTIPRKERKRLRRLKAKK